MIHALLFFFLAPSAPSHDALRLARVFSCEAWGSERDARAIVHVLNARRELPAHRGISLAEMGDRYSTCRRSSSPWVRSVLRLPWESLPPAARHVALHSSTVADPCRGRATHWGHPSIVPVARRLQCGRTKNAFTR